MEKIYKINMNVFICAYQLIGHFGVQTLGLADILTSLAIFWLSCISYSLAVKAF